MTRTLRLATAALLAPAGCEAEPGEVPETADAEAGPVEGEVELEEEMVLGPDDVGETILATGWVTAPLPTGFFLPAEDGRGPASPTWLNPPPLLSPGRDDAYTAPFREDEGRRRVEPGPSCRPADATDTATCTAKGSASPVFNQIKPGYVFEFGVCPSTIISPPALANKLDNTRIEPWPDHLRALGGVRCLSHPLGTSADAAAFVANNIRTGGDAGARARSYSPAGNLARAVTFRRNVTIGNATADFVGYIEGQSNYVESQRTVFSKDFSGCLMVAFNRNGTRCVAHVAASLEPTSDCKHTFLHALSNHIGAHYDLIGWFQP